MIIAPDQKFNPDFQDKITGGTKLAPGVTLSKFFGGSGNPCSISSIEKYRLNENDELKQLARNLYLHAELFRSINGKTDQFKDIRLVIVEGVYRGGPQEGFGDNEKEIRGDNILKQEGRLVVYKVIDEFGKVDLERTFDVAEYWKDYMNYELLSLEYDKWDPSGVINGQIAVTMPKVTESYDVDFGMGVQTFYNGQLFSANELVEVLEN